MQKSGFLYFIIDTWLFLLSALMLVGCSINANEGQFIVKENLSEKISDAEVRNLQKLCKVWGYTKYNHPAFLLGKRDWDQDLIELIPKISTANDEQEANHILYSWFSGLGEIDYGTNLKIQEWKIASDEDIYATADTDWRADENYLGASLSTALLQFQEIPNITWAKAPISFDRFADSIFYLSNFKNEKPYEDMDYSNAHYRLLGLFRFWNAIEYYFPYKDIMDEDWDDILIEFIPKMLEGKDKQSYELTLAEIGARLHDGHVSLEDRSSIKNKFGDFMVPALVTKAEGEIVIFDVLADSCPLIKGDVLLQVDGVDMKDIIEKGKKYLSVPNNEKILNSLITYLVRAHNEKIEITVLRGSERLSFTVEGIDQSKYNSLWEAVSESHVLLENNIGLINPSALSAGEIHQIMTEFANTDGLIIDLRQYPSDFITYSLAEYLVDKRTVFANMSHPSRAVPGTFIKANPPLYSGRISGSLGYYYKNNVVILMDEFTMSQAEFTVMSLRNGPHVTVMGENSIGADGNVTSLPLPGGNQIGFTGLGVYTPEGNQTQRIGLSPDIYVSRTIEGIKEGRDEVMESAIQFIMGNK